MPVLDLFSKRQRRLKGGIADVYTYDVIPLPLRVQIVQILDDSLGDGHEFNMSATRGNGPHRAYTTIVEWLRREYGVFCLADLNVPGRGGDARSELQAFILNERKAERVLDAVELCFRWLDKLARDYDYRFRSNADALVTQAISELNIRFQEQGVGYSYEAGEILRVESQLIHSEVVKPTLVLLSDEKFKGAEEEFRAAHEHFRKQEHKEALNCSLKALESTLKTICDLRTWPYDPHKATAKSLLEICFANQLVPEFWLNTMSGLRVVLENGVPTARNRLGGHGQGSQPTSVPHSVAAFVLHMAASAILFLIQAHDETK